MHSEKSPASPPANPDSLLDALKKIYGFEAFRPYQEEIVQALMAGQDAFVVMPTGGGKSLCFQLPAHLMEGTCLVISPLISLMKDQVDAARANGLRAACLHSAMPVVERREVTGGLLQGTLDLLYISPERLVLDGFTQLLGRVKLAFAAVDEAHCISEWGHDFRPDYLGLADIRTDFPGLPVAAFTATATRKVQEDIIHRLGLRDPHLVRASFNRPNLFYKVISKQHPERQILTFIQSRPGESGIVYRTTRKSVEKTALSLQAAGIRALPYHAGLSDELRAANQEAFNRDDAEVVVATIAFGMGIDKSNVRYVLHADLPKNIEGYYQETGRAGRDGEPAHCLLLFGYGDIAKMRYFINQAESEDERRRTERGLKEMTRYANVYACRRKQLLGYFGEALDESDCGACDICTGQVDRVEATRDAQIVLSAVARTGERFGIGHIVDVVTGADTERIRQLGHEEIKTYGVGRDQPKAHWRTVVDNLLAQELLAQTDDQYPVLRLLPDARKVLFSSQEVWVLKARKAPARRKGRKAAVSGLPYNEALFEVLRAERKQCAARQHVPPYVVFSDKTLHEMARVMPGTLLDMAGISGVGQAKLKRYGEIFLDAIHAYRDAHPDAGPESLE